MLSVPSYNLHGLHAFPLLLKKTLKNICYNFGGERPEDVALVVVQGFQFLLRRLHNCFQIEVHSIPWLSDTGAPLKGQAGSAGNGTENFHSAQSPPTSAAFLVKAVGNAARNHGSLSGQP